MNILICPSGSLIVSRRYCAWSIRSLCQAVPIDLDVSCRKSESFLSSAICIASSSFCQSSPETIYEKRWSSVDMIVSICVSSELSAEKQGYEDKLAELYEEWESRSEELQSFENGEDE